MDTILVQVTHKCYHEKVVIDAIGGDADDAGIYPHEQEYKDDGCQHP